MATHTRHSEKNTFYFLTFTCYKWLPLIEKSQLYDYFQGWIVQLAKRGILVNGYVFMPNHIHPLVYVQGNCKGLNQIIGEAKRFMAYEIVRRLQNLKELGILQVLADGVQKEEQKKGKKHQVFRLSFDAKEVKGQKEIGSVLDYIHHNPVSGKWNLVSDFVDYPHSSARYYETGDHMNIKVYDFRMDFSESSSSDSEGA